MTSRYWSKRTRIELLCSIYNEDDTSKYSFNHVASQCMLLMSLLLCMVQSYKTDAQKSICNKFSAKWHSLTWVRYNLLTKYTTYMNIEHSNKCVLQTDTNKHTCKLTCNKLAHLLHLNRCAISTLVVYFYFFDIKTLLLSSWEVGEWELHNIYCGNNRNVSWRLGCKNCVQGRGKIRWEHLQVEVNTVKWMLHGIWITLL